jgi:beta-lactamase regulating signal transducer with metallopeptidase domain
MSAGEAGGIWLLLELTLKGSALLTAALVASLLFRRAPAALRHTVWSLALFGVLLIPAASLVLPAWEVSIPSPALSASTVASLGGPYAPGGAASELSTAAGLAVTQPAGPVVPLNGGTTETAAVESARPAPETSETFASGAMWRTWIVRVWALGAGLLTLRLLAGSVQVWRMRRRATAVTDPAWLSLRDELANQLGVKSHAKLLRAERSVMPMTWGVLEPVILLPPDAAEWSVARRRTVLAHELAHVQRRDALTQWTGHIALVVQWFNPLVWLATRRLCEERERACDDAVLTLGAEPVEYAEHLLDIVRTLGTATGPAPVMSMARRSRFEGRLLAVLDRQVRRGPAGAGKTVLAAAIALSALLPLAALKPGAAAARAETAAAAAPIDASTAHTGLGVETLPAGTEGSGPAGSEPSPSSRPAPGRVVPDTAGRPYTYSAVIQRTYLKAGPAQVRLATETAIEATDVFLTPDRTGVTGIRAGGALQVVETGLPGHPDSAGATTRRLLITPLPGGALQHDYQIDGVNSAFDAEARAWLASLLPFLKRETTPAPPRAATTRPTPPRSAVERVAVTTGRTVHRPVGSGPFPASPVVVRIKAQDVFLTADGDGIASILTGGFLQVEMERTDSAAIPGPETRHLLVTPLQGDRLHYDYRVDGVNLPFDADARAWLASIIRTDMR